MGDDRSLSLRLILVINAFDGQQRIATTMPSGWAVAYATSTMRHEVERPALTLAGAALARTPFEQRVC
jgi:hypothetical protein